MKISTDGGTTWINVEQVKVLKAIDHSDGLDAEIVFKFTDEGLITDVWVMDVCEGTSSETYLEIGDRLVYGADSIKN
jgi:hypothetical protein